MAVRIIDVFMVAYYSVAIVAGIIWSIADKDSLTFGIILLGVALILNTFAIPALVWDKNKKRRKTKIPSRPQPKRPKKRPKKPKKK